MPRRGPFIVVGISVIAVGIADGFHFGAAGGSLHRLRTKHLCPTPIPLVGHRAAVRHEPFAAQIVSCESSEFASKQLPDLSIGAEEHWKTFEEWPGGDFLGRFCRWDPVTCATVGDVKVLRSYHWHEKDSDDPYLKQDNKIFFEDERGVVERGPWHVRKKYGNTPRGFIHERVDEVNPATFVTAPGPAFSQLSWFSHRIGVPLQNPGVIPLKTTDNAAGYMIELILQADAHVRFSVGMVFDASTLNLQHFTLNREDDRGFPSQFWSADTHMRPLLLPQIDAELKLSDHTTLRGSGYESTFSEHGLVRRKIEVEWKGHLRALQVTDIAARAAPDGVILLAPLSLSALSPLTSSPWACAFLWRPPSPESAAAADCVYSWETRYDADGAFESFRCLRFDLP